MSKTPVNVSTRESSYNVVRLTSGSPRAPRLPLQVRRHPARELTAASQVLRLLHVRHRRTPFLFTLDVTLNASKDSVTTAGILASGESHSLHLLPQGAHDVCLAALRLPVYLPSRTSDHRGKIDVIVRDIVLRQNLRHVKLA